MIKDQNFGRFNLRHKNHKWLHGVPERHSFQIAVVVPLAHQGKLYIKDT